MLMLRILKLMMTKETMIKTMSNKTMIVDWKSVLLLLMVIQLAQGQTPSTLAPSPTFAPTFAPTFVPTSSWTPTTALQRTDAPTTDAPITALPTTDAPTLEPSTMAPTALPSGQPSLTPTLSFQPSVSSQPSGVPTMTRMPTAKPTPWPTPAPIPAPPEEDEANTTMIVIVLLIAVTIPICCGCNRSHILVDEFQSAEQAAADFRQEIMTKRRFVVTIPEVTACGGKKLTQRHEYALFYSTRIKAHWKPMHTYAQMGLGWLGLCTTIVALFAPDNKTNEVVGFTALFVNELLTHTWYGYIRYLFKGCNGMCSKHGVDDSDDSDFEDMKVLFGILYHGGHHELENAFWVDVIGFPFYAVMYLSTLATFVATFFALAILKIVGKSDNNRKRDDDSLDAGGMASLSAFAGIVLGCFAYPLMFLALPTAGGKVFASFMHHCCSEYYEAKLFRKRPSEFVLSVIFKVFGDFVGVEDFDTDTDFQDAWNEIRAAADEEEMNSSDDPENPSSSRGGKLADRAARDDPTAREDSSETEHNPTAPGDSSNQNEDIDHNNPGDLGINRRRSFVRGIRRQQRDDSTNGEDYSETEHSDTAQPLVLGVQTPPPAPPMLVLPVAPSSEASLSDDEGQRNSSLTMLTLPVVRDDADGPSGGPESDRPENTKKNKKQKTRESVFLDDANTAASKNAIDTPMELEKKKEKRKKSKKKRDSLEDHSKVSADATRSTMQEEQREEEKRDTTTVSMQEEDISEVSGNIEANDHYNTALEIARREKLKKKKKKKKKSSRKPSSSSHQDGHRTKEEEGEKEEEESQTDTEQA